MIEAVVRRWLKGADPTALTARETLQRALDYGRRVRDVARSEIWVFRWPSGVEPRSLLLRLTQETNLLANPNTHAVEIRLGEERLHPRGNSWVVVTVPGEGVGLGRTLERHRLLVPPAPRTARLTFWELDLDGPEADRRELALEIAVARERRHGLLANPQVGEARVLTAAPTALALVSVALPATAAEGMG